MSLVMRYPQHCKAVSSVAASKEGIEVGLFCCAEYPGVSASELQICV